MTVLQRVQEQVEEHIRFTLNAFEQKLELYALQLEHHV